MRRGPLIATTLSLPCC